MKIANPTPKITPPILSQRNLEIIVKNSRSSPVDLSSIILKMTITTPSHNKVYP